MSGFVEPSDDELVRRSILEPHSNAFAQLIQRHQSRLRLFLQGLCGQHGVADELAQETFIKAHRSLSNFKFQSSFKTWLMSIARNLFIDQTRLAGFQSRNLYTAENEAESITEPLEHWAHAEDQIIFRIDLHRAMLHLNPVEREVIAHCYFADLSMSETATLMSMPLGTIKTHAQRALTKLRLVFSDNTDEAGKERRKP